jgi:hypothetical protein
VTVLEILSPTNKRPGRGRRIYEDTRMEVLASRTHLVEIDLVRAGEPMPITGNGRGCDYRMLVSRGDCRPNLLSMPLQSASRFPSSLCR